MAPHPGAVALGALTGIGLGVLAAIPVLAAGFESSEVAGQSLLILIGIAGQFVAGFVAGRIAARDDETHGGLAGITAFAVVAAISLAAGEEPGLGTLAVGAVTALVVGSLGGLLSRSRRV